MDTTTSTQNQPLTSNVDVSLLILSIILLLVWACVVYAVCCRMQCSRKRTSQHHELNDILTSYEVDSSDSNMDTEESTANDILS